MVYAVIIGYLYRIGGIKLKKFMPICCNGVELACDMIGHNADAHYLVYRLRKFGEEKIVY
jgi:hypothetical protein